MGAVARMFANSRKRNVGAKAEKGAIVRGYSGKSSPRQL